MNAQIDSRLKNLYHQVVGLFKSQGVEENQIQEVMMSETKEAEAPAEAKEKKSEHSMIEEIHDFLFTDDEVADEEVPLAVVEEPKEEAEAPVAEESKQEEAKEEAPEWFKTYKEEQDAKVKEKDEKIEKLKKKLKVAEEAPVVDPLVHNPEAEAPKQWKRGNDPKESPDDPTSAFMHNLVQE